MKYSSLILLLSFLQFLNVLSVDSDTPITELEDDVIELEEPPKDSGKKLFKLLHARKTQHDYEGDKSITLKQLSELLWAAYGPNRENMHKTVPSAVFMYPLRFYVFMKTGIYKYDPDNYELNLVLSGDYREKTGSQDFVAKADINIVMIADYKAKVPIEGFEMDDDTRYQFSLLDAGHCSQNMYLYCANEDFKCNVRAMFDNDTIIKVLDLDAKRYKVVVTFSVGY